jgi:hypothetical protein
MKPALLSKKPALLSKKPALLSKKPVLCTLKCSLEVTRITECSMQHFSFQSAHDLVKRVNKQFMASSYNMQKFESIDGNQKKLSTENVVY